MSFNKIEIHMKLALRMAQDIKCIMKKLLPLEALNIYESNTPESCVTKTKCLDSLKPVM